LINLTDVKTLHELRLIPDSRNKEQINTQVNDFSVTLLKFLMFLFGNGLKIFLEE